MGRLAAALLPGCTALALAVVAGAASASWQFGGGLIVTDEVSGTIWAFGPDGTTQPVVGSGLPGGGDVGVEGVAFVPSGFLRLTSAEREAAGVQEGDLIAVTEGGMQAIAIRCADTCAVMPVVGGATRAHGQDHLVFTMSSASPPSPSPSSAGTTVTAVSPARSKGSQSPATVVAIIVVLVVLGAGALAVLRGRLEPPGSGSAPPSR